MSWLGLDSLAPLSDTEDDDVRTAATMHCGANGGKTDAKCEENIPGAGNRKVVTFDAPTGLRTRNTSPSKDSVAKSTEHSHPIAVTLGATGPKEKEKRERSKRRKRKKKKAGKCKKEKAVSFSTKETVEIALASVDASRTNSVPAIAPGDRSEAELPGPPPKELARVESQDTSMDLPGANESIELNAVKRSRPRRSTKFRQSNALNEDRYDFCLLIDMEKGRETSDNRRCRFGSSGGSNSNRENEGASDSGSGCCTCTTKNRLCNMVANSKYVEDESDLDLDDEDDTDSSSDEADITGIGATTENNYNDDENVAIEIAEEGVLEPRDDEANLHALRRLQAKSQKKRRLALLADEDDDVQNGESVLPKESISSRHTGIGLSGSRMVRLITLKLREAGLKVKRLRNLSGTRTLIKVRAPQQRLEEEAERMKLVMRTKDGGYDTFKIENRHIFCGAGYEDEHRGNALDIKRASISNGNRVMFRSSDRQSILLHIIKSDRTLGGAQLRYKSEPCAAAIVSMFPVHMWLRIKELRRTWSTAFCCCRAPPKNRYGSLLPRGASGRDGDVLSKLPFDFSEEDKERERTELALTSSSPSSFRPGQSKSANAEGESDNTSVASRKCGKGCNCCRKQRSKSHKSGSFDPDDELEAGECRCCKCYSSFSLHNFCDFVTCGWMLRQPLDAIGEYFGETVGFYFAFLEFYTTWLLLPSIAGIVLFCFQVYYRRIDHWLLPFYSLFVGLWSMLFLVRWRRRSVELAYRWGVKDLQEEEGARVEFVGKMRRSGITGEEELYYSPKRRAAKMIFLSWPTVIVWVGATATLMVCLFMTRDTIMDDFAKAETFGTNGTNATSPGPSDGQGFAAESSGYIGSSFLNFRTTDNPRTTMSLDLSDRDRYGNDVLFWLYLLIPPITFGALIPVLDFFFNKVATVLNDWENHRTESEYQFHLTAKVLSFRLVNCFCSLYYYAFSGRHSILRLTVQLASFMVVGQCTKKIKEVLIPCLRRKLKTWFAQRALKKEKLKAEQKQKKVSLKTLSRRRISQGSAEIWAEARLPVYKTFNDYAEMMVQFGYVTFFSMAFPLAPGFALLNNLVEIRSDAFKLCNNTRRPIAQKASGIGVWFHALQMMSVLAVLTNLAHIGFTSDQFSQFFPNVTDAEKVVIIFAFEHAVLVIQSIVVAVSPREPAWVRRSIKRENFLSKERRRKLIAEQLRQKREMK